MNKTRIAELAKEAQEETNIMMIMAFKDFESALWEKFAELVIKENKEQLMIEIVQLRTRVKILEKAAADDSWTRNPDRMGGAYSPDEVTYNWK